MCGIFGTTEPIDDDRARGLLNLFGHRGPDASRTYRNDRIVFGHNRLSILDLDERSHQPFTRSEDVLVFNGEIYNFKDIRSKLAAHGHTFDTTSDTEVLIKAYQQFGDSMVEDLNGMFAFVLFDRKRNRLLGARDRFGKKPLYFRSDGGHFAFSSNLYSLCKPGDAIDPEARSAYFWNGYVPGEESIIRGIRKLKPGHAFEYDLSRQAFSTWPYWSLPESEGGRLSRSEYHEQLDELLDDAVRIRLVADVPVGIFLSGGIDSTVVTRYAVRHSERIRTFSIRFENDGFDESRYAEFAARKLGTTHMTIPCTVDDLFDMVAGFSTYFDEPFADASAIPSLLLAKKTREHVTVALSGDGGDEVFYGYSRYRWFRWISMMFDLPHVGRMSALSVLKRMQPGRRRQWEFILSAPTREAAYVRFMGSTHGLMREPSGLPTSVREWEHQGIGQGFTRKMADRDVRHYLPDDILVKVDRATMAYSLEARSPLLDYRIAELTRSQPVSYNFSAFDGKKSLKHLLSPTFDRSFIHRRKQGFTLPLKEWFRQELKEEVEHWVFGTDLLEEIGLHDTTLFRRQVRAHMKGETNAYPDIWKLMVYARWSDHVKQHVG
jgi:asparagine synthase (glutamine-hydrolysing)